MFARCAFVFEGQAGCEWEKANYPDNPRETVAWLYNNRGVVRRLIESGPTPVVVTLETYRLRAGGVDDHAALSSDHALHGMI